MSEYLVPGLKCALLAGGLLSTHAVAQDRMQGAEEDAAESLVAQEVAEPEDTIIVTGRARKLYRVDATTTGKLASPPLESSQIITSITEELIEDQGARDAQDLYRNIPGVSFFSYAGVTARGFRQEEIFYDGLRGDPYAGFSVPQLFNIRRVEFLKGPAGMLYGPGAPGGLFNYITKKPTDGLSAELRGIVGNRDRFGSSAEISGPISGGLLGRAGLFYEEQDGFRFLTAERTLIADGGLAYEFGGSRITLQATRYDQELDANRLRGVPVNDKGEFLTDIRWNHNEPGDFLNLRSDVFQAIFETTVFDSVTFDARVRYNDATERQQYHEPRALFDSDGDGFLDATVREYRDQRRDQQTWSAGANFVWESELGGFDNRVLVGGDYFTGELDFDSRRVRGRPVPTPGLPDPLSLFDPQYGVSDPATYALPAFQNRLTEGYRWGAYLLDELTIDRLILTGGVRFDRFEDSISGGAFGATQDDSFTDEEFSYRAGAVYRLTDEVSLFGQYATTFEPQSISAQDPRAGGPFDPTTGDIWEAGVKTALWNGRLQSSVSAYRIKRQNILQADPRGDLNADGVDDLVAVGEVTSEGIDVELAADITPDWVALVAYAYNDARITADNAGGGFSNNVGDRFANAPEHQLGFWTRYQFRDPGIAVAVGGDYVSDRLSLSGQEVDSSIVFDASLIYEPGPWRVLLRVDNIFDTTYAASGFIERTGHFPGQPRSVFVELGFDF